MFVFCIASLLALAIAQDSEINHPGIIRQESYDDYRNYMISSNEATFNYIQTQNEADIAVLDQFKWPRVSVSYSVTCPGTDSVCEAKLLEEPNPSFVSLMKDFIETYNITRGYQKSRVMKIVPITADARVGFVGNTTWNFEGNAREFSCDIRYNFFKTKKYTVEMPCK